MVPFHGRKQLRCRGLSFLPRGIAHAQHAAQEPPRFVLLVLPTGFEQCTYDLEAPWEGGVMGTLESTATVLTLQTIDAVHKHQYQL